MTTGTLIRPSIDLDRLAGGVELCAALEDLGRPLSTAVIGHRMDRFDAPPGRQLGNRRVWWYWDAVYYLIGAGQDFLDAQGWPAWRDAPDVVGLSEIIPQVPYLRRLKTAKTRATEKLGEKDAPEGVLLRSGRVWRDGGRLAVDYLNQKRDSRYGEPKPRTEDDDD